MVARLALLRGYVRSADGDDAGARAAIADSLNLCLQHGYQRGAAQSLLAWAATTARRRTSLDVVRVLAVVQAAAAADGWALTAAEATTAGDILTAATADLGIEQTERSSAAGAALTLPEAAALALRGRGPRGRTHTGWSALTTTETRVVDLIADGLVQPGDRRGTVRQPRNGQRARLGRTAQARRTQPNRAGRARRGATRVDLTGKPPSRGAITRASVGIVEAGQRTGTTFRQREPTMTNNPNFDRAEAALAAARNGDYGPAFDSFADDIVMENGPGAGPWHIARGKDELALLQMEFSAALGDTFHHGRHLHLRGRTRRHQPHPRDRQGALR